MASLDSKNISGLDNVLGNLGIVGRKTLDKAVLQSKKIAAEMENDAKTNRTWTDRSGDARRSITGSVEEKVGAVVIYLAIGVEYGPPLEEGFGGRYAIIIPTIDIYRRKYLDEYKGIL